MFFEPAPASSFLGILGKTVTVRIKRRYQDIAIINIERSGKSDGQDAKKPNTLLYVLLAVLGTMVLLGIGYLAGVKAGYLQPHAVLCCDGALDLNFDFDFDADG